MIPTTPEAYQLLHDGTIALAQVERNGIRVDTDYLGKAIESTGREIEALAEELRGDDVYKAWRRRYGTKAKLGNSKQLATVLFDDLGYADAGQTASGKYKSDEAAFEDIDHPFVKKHTKLGKLEKARGTFLNGIKKEVDERGYLHAFYNLNLARSFRSSSDRVNFQNFPVRIEWISKLIRSCFIARDGHQLIETDLVGAEVRCAACYHKDPTMLSYIKDPTKDMHRDMAAQIYMLKEGQVSKLARYTAKNMFVFPQFYGDFYINNARQMWGAIDRMGIKVEGPGDVSLKEHLRDHGITKLGECNAQIKPKKGTFEHHLKSVEQDFWGRRFKVYAAWKKRWWSKYESTGSFQMLTGFWVNNIHNRKEVINYPVQGAAFHWLLWSLIQLQKWMNKNRMKSKIVGQIHDSIVADVHKREVDDYLHAVKHIVTQQLVQHWAWIIVPLEIEAEVSPLGGSWFDKKKVEV